MWGPDPHHHQMDGKCGIVFSGCISLITNKNFKKVRIISCISYSLMDLFGSSFHVHWVICLFTWFIRVLSIFWICPLLVIHMCAKCLFLVCWISFHYFTVCYHEQIFIQCGQINLSVYAFAILFEHLEIFYISFWKFKKFFAFI